MSAADFVVLEALLSSAFVVVLFALGYIAGFSQ